MDNASGFSTMNFSNFRLSRALSSFDATHNFVLSYNYEIPFGQAFAGAPKRLRRGLVTERHHALRDRVPDRHLAERRPIAHRGGRRRPSGLHRRTGDHQRRAQHAESPVLQQERLYIRSAGDDGERQSALLPRPGLNNFDLGVQKITRVRESMSVQFRAEFFNAFEPCAVQQSAGELLERDVRPRYQRQGRTHRADELEVPLVIGGSNRSCLAARLPRPWAA